MAPPKVPTLSEWQAHGGAHGSGVIKREIGCRPRIPQPRLCQSLRLQRPPFHVCLRGGRVAAFPRQSVRRAPAVPGRPARLQPAPRSSSPPFRGSPETKASRPLGDDAGAWAAHSQPEPGGENSGTSGQFPALLGPGSSLLQGPRTRKAGAPPRPG